MTQQNCRNSFVCGRCQARYWDWEECNCQTRTDGERPIEQQFPIGTKVIVPNWCGIQTKGKVIGHYNGRVIVETLPITYDSAELKIIDEER